MRRLLPFLALLVLPVTVQAQNTARPMVSDVSISRVEIQTSFDGADLLLFGAVANDQLAAEEKDLIVVVRGPTEKVAVRKKSRVAGIWVNRDHVTFDDVPGFYALTSTRPLEALDAKDELKRLRIGATNLVLKPSRRLKPVESERFQAALIRNKNKAGLFAEAPGKVYLRDGLLFRTDVHMPSNVPPGIYDADVYLVAEGRVQAMDSILIEVVQTGVERAIHDFAHDRAWAYGLAAIFTACLAGWIAGQFGRKA